MSFQVAQGMCSTSQYLYCSLSYKKAFSYFLGSVTQQKTKGTPAGTLTHGLRHFVPNFSPCVVAP